MATEEWYGIAGDRLTGRLSDNRRAEARAHGAVEPRELRELSERLKLELRRFVPPFVPVDGFENRYELWSMK